LLFNVLLAITYNFYQYNPLSQLALILEQLILLLVRY